MNSFSILHSILGYSKTEWAQESMHSRSFRELLLGTEQHPKVLMRLKYPDRLSQSVEIQLFCYEDSSATSLSHTIAYILNQLIFYEHITRFYCFLFTFEQQERELLKSLGFYQEAILNQQVYVRGKYRDILVLGTKRLEGSCIQTV